MTINGSTLDFIRSRLMDLQKSTEIAEIITERVCWALDFSPTTAQTIKGIICDELEDS